MGTTETTTETTTMAPTVAIAKTTKTFRQKVSHFPWRLLMGAVCVSFGGSFHFGYQLTYINPTETVFQRFINESCYEHFGSYLDDLGYRILWSCILNLQIVGSFFGTLPLVRLVERLGRRRSFYVSAGITLLGAALQALSKTADSFEMYAVGRLVIGVGNGLALGLEPIYLNEISPKHLRGFVGGLTAVFVEFGFLLGGVFGLPRLLGTDRLWPLIPALEALPIMLLFVTVPFLHDSPKYLASRGQRDAARAALVYFGHSRVDERLAEINAEIQYQEKKVTLKEVMQRPYLRKAVILGTLVACTGAMSGITAVDFFSTKLLEDAGLTHEAAQYASVGIFVQCFLSSLVSSFVLHRTGRRTLLLFSNMLLILVDVALMTFTIVNQEYGYAWAGYLSVAVCIVFTFTFGIGPAILQWTVPSELVPQTARSTSHFVAMTVHKIALIVVGVSFYPLQLVIGSFSFFIFIVPLVIFFITFYFVFPETKNKSIVEIMRALGRDDVKAELEAADNNVFHTKI